MGPCHVHETNVHRHCSCPHPQGVVKQMMLMHNSETYRQLLLQTRLQGESEDAATVRWRQMAVSGALGEARSGW